MITILGYGCVLCGFFYKAIKEAAQEKGWQVEVVYSKDRELMAAHQIENTPAILLDDKVIGMGCRSTKRALELLDEIFKTGVFPPDQKNKFQGEIK